MALDALWDAVRAAGVTLTLEGDALRAQPSQALSDPLRALIRRYKSEIISQLGALEAAEIDEFELYTLADLVEFDGLIKRFCHREGRPPDELLDVRRRMAPVRVISELRAFREMVYRASASYRQVAPLREPINA